MELVDPPPVRFFHLEMKATACPWPEDVWFPQGHFGIFHDVCDVGLEFGRGAPRP